jgi:hypothetical protein
MDLPGPIDAASVTAENYGELLAALSAMPARLDAVIAAVPETLWRTRQANGAFSLLEHACHLRDLDREAYLARLERMLAEETPALADVDGGKLAEERDYQRQDLRAALSAFAGSRADLVRRFAGLSPSERQRRGTLEGVGEITVDGLASVVLRHDCEHVAELAALQQELLGAADANGQPAAVS